MIEENKSLIRQYLTALSGKEKPESIVNIYVNDENLKQHIQVFESAFPRYKLTTDDIIAEGEKYLRGLGLRQLRVRHHGTIARIEVDEKDLELVLKPDIRRGISDRFKTLGYHYVTLDLSGYHTGSLNIGTTPSKGKGN